MTPTFDALASRFSPRVAVTLVFALFGVVGGLWPGAIPVITNRIGIGAEELGLWFLFAVLTNVVAFAAGAPLSRFVSGRMTMAVMMPIVGIFAVILHASTDRWMFVPALLILSFCQGLVDLAMNAEGSAVESELKKPILTGMHGTVSLMVAIFALVGSLASVNYGPASVWPMQIASGFLAGWIAWRFIPTRSIRVRGPQAAASAGVRSWPLTMLGIAMGFAFVGELVAFLWSSKLLDTEAPQFASIAGIGTSFLCGCAALARMFGDRIRSRFGDTRVIVLSLAVAAFGYILYALTSGFAPHVAAFAIIGLGTAYITPGFFAIAAASHPAARAAAIGFVVAVAGPIRIVAPYVFGWLTQNSSPSAAFGVFAGLLIVAAGLFLLSQRMMLRLSSGRAEART